jgi:hypothetical protein
MWSRFLHRWQCTPISRWRAQRVLRAIPDVTPGADAAALARLLRMQSARERARRSTTTEPGVFRPTETSEHSQHGEDGAIRDLFLRLDGAEKPGTFVEIGAADGAENCTRTLMERGWSGVWIEGDPALARRAESVVGGRPVTVIDHYVDRDSIADLSRHWPDELDLLVVDIDGNDYWVCDATLRRVRPRVLVVEYNGSFGPIVRWVARYDPERRWDATADHGASLSAFDTLARARGYRLVYCEESGTNAFFVRGELDSGFPELPARRLFQPPVHKLPNGHPVSAHDPTPTSPTTSSQDVGLELTWVETDAVERGASLYAVVTLANRGMVAVGNDEPAPTLVTWTWSHEDESTTCEPTRVSVTSWTLPPGSSIALPVRVEAPADCGRRELRLAAVQEGVRWFDGTVSAQVRIVEKTGGVVGRPRAPEFRRWWAHEDSGKCR